MSIQITLLSRLTAAIGGGYAITALATIIASRFLVWCELAAVEATMWVTIVSYPVFVALAMMFFHARSGRTAWIGIGATSAFLATLILVMQIAAGE